MAAGGEIRAVAEHTSLTGLQDCDGYCRRGDGCVGTISVAAGLTVVVALPIRPAFLENDFETCKKLHTPTTQVPT